MPLSGSDYRAPRHAPTCLTWVTYAPPVRVELVRVWPSLSGVHRRPRTVVCLGCRTFAYCSVLAALRRRWPRAYGDGGVDIRSVLGVPCGRRLDHARQGTRG